MALAHKFASATKTRAERDARAFERRLISKGGQLGDGVISRDEAFSRLVECARKKYRTAGGPIDFWPFPLAYQLGSGDKVYSFHGFEGTLIDHTSYGVNGFVGDGTTRPYVITPIKRVGVTKRTSIFVQTNLASGNAAAYLSSCTNGYHGFGGGAGVFIGGAASQGNAGAGNWVAYEIKANAIYSNPRAFCLTFNNGTRRQYINGIFVDEAGNRITADTIPASSPYSDSDFLRFGSTGSAGGGLNYNGTYTYALDHPDILTDAQVAQLHDDFKTTIGKDLVGLP